MTVTQQARRSDALYYGNMSKRELCDMIAHLEADNEMLAEEADARAKSAGTWKDAVSAHARRGVTLDRLVVDMYRQLLNAYDAKELEEFRDRLWELGIEVDADE